MNDPHVVTGLMAKRAELAGHVAHHEAEVRRLLAAIDAIDKALLLFKPEIDVSTIKARPLPARYAARRGELSRIVLGALREAGRALTTKELATLVMAARGMDAGDSDLAAVIIGRVRTCLRQQRIGGVVRSVGGVDDRVAWKVAG